MNPISVTFIGEPAVDAGGPSREFLRLLMQDMCKSSFFEGADDSRVPAHDMVAVENCTYKHMGKLILHVINSSRYLGNRPSINAWNVDYIALSCKGCGWSPQNWHLACWYSSNPEFFRTCLYTITVFPRIEAASE